MKKGYALLPFILSIILIIGCSKNNNTMSTSQNDTVQETADAQSINDQETDDYYQEPTNDEDDNYQEPDDEYPDDYQEPDDEYPDDYQEPDDEYPDGYQEPDDEYYDDDYYNDSSDYTREIGEEYMKTNEQGIKFGGYSDSAQFAYIKADGFKECYIFTSVGDDTLWLRLDNNSLSNMIITRAYVTVIDYQPVSYDDYIVKYAGAGDPFDSNLVLYAEADSLKEEYLACPATGDEFGNIVSISKDPVINLEIPANDGINVVYDVAFRKPGIYRYRAYIEYEYNNSINTVYIDSDILFDDLTSDELETKLTESHEYTEFGY